MAEKTLKSRLMLATNTYANWVANETVPKLGEVCLVVDDDGAHTGRYKVGDGVHSFEQLAWFTGGGGVDTYVTSATNFSGNTLTIKQETHDEAVGSTTPKTDISVQIPNASGSAAGLMTSADKTKLDSLGIGYQNVIVGTTTATATSAAKKLTFASSATNPVSIALNNSTHTITMGALDTKNTVGATTSNSKLYLVGVTTTGANPQSYVNTNAYTQSGVLYSNGSAVVTTANVTSTIGDSTTATSIPNTGAVKAYVTDLLDDITGIDFQVVTTLPATGVKGVIYLVSHGGSAPEVYDEYIWLSDSSSFEKIGTTEVDLTNYVEFSDVSGTQGITVTTASGAVTVKHSNSVTAGTASGTNTSVNFGGKIEIPTITYDAQGHITSVGKTTATLPSSAAQWAQNYYTTAATYTAASTKGTIEHTRNDGGTYSVDLPLVTATNAGLAPAAASTAVAYTASVSSGTKLGTLKVTKAGGAATNTDIYAPTIPSSLKNPNSLFLAANGTTAMGYDGSAASTANFKTGFMTEVTKSGSGQNISYQIGLTQTYSGGSTTTGTDANKDVLILDGRF